MITREEVERIGRSKGIANVGYAEKDYLLDVLLLIISGETKDELVFKGGTCLHKFYGLGRFSEDADFTAVKDLDVDLLLKKSIARINDFGIECNLKKKKEPYNSVLTTFAIKGPLYTGDERTICSLRMDINLKSSIDLQPEYKVYSSYFPEIPNFGLLVMREEEILAEKVRAITTRDNARDLYDLWFLMKKGVPVDEELISKKMQYYSMMWDKTEFLKKVDDKKHLWQMELTPFVLGNLPEFEECAAYVKSKIEI